MQIKTSGNCDEKTRRFITKEWSKNKGTLASISIVVINIIIEFTNTNHSYEPRTTYCMHELKGFVGNLRCSKNTNTNRIIEILSMN